MDSLRLTSVSEPTNDHSADQTPIWLSMTTMVLIVRPAKRPCTRCASPEPVYSERYLLNRQKPVPATIVQYRPATTAVTVLHWLTFQTVSSPVPS